MAVSNNRLNILLVENGDENRKLISKRFESYTHMKLMAAKDLGEARAILSNVDPDLALVDYGMSAGSGSDLIKALRRKNYPIIMMTNDTGEVQDLDLLETGTFDYIVKSSDTIKNLPIIAERIFLKWDQANHKKKAEEKLRRQYLELRKIKKELDHFVYSTAHDLRAPLLSVLGLINLTKMESGQPKQHEYLDMMEQCVKKLDKHVIDISNYSKNNRLELNIAKVNPRMLINEVIRDHSFLGDFSKLRMDVRVQNSYPLYTDENRLKIILNNLLFNAITYHNYDQKDPFVMIYIAVGKHKCEINVTDNGRGIAPHHQVKIFEMFYRASESSEGAGLGLYIVKETVNKLKGSISVRSFLKTGTRFTVVIPNKKTDQG